MTSIPRDLLADIKGDGRGKESTTCSGLTLLIKLAEAKEQLGQ